MRMGVDCGIFRVVRRGVENMGVWEGDLSEMGGECEYLYIEGRVRWWGLSEGEVEEKRGDFESVWDLGGEVWVG